MLSAGLIIKGRRAKSFLTVVNELLTYPGHTFEYDVVCEAHKCETWVVISSYWSEINWQNGRISYIRIKRRVEHFCYQRANICTCQHDPRGIDHSNVIPIAVFQVAAVDRFDMICAWLQSQRLFTVETVSTPCLARYRRGCDLPLESKVVIFILNVVMGWPVCDGRP